MTITQVAFEEKYFDNDGGSENKTAVARNWPMEKMEMLSKQYRSGTLKGYSKPSFDSIDSFVKELLDVKGTVQWSQLLRSLDTKAYKGRFLKKQIKTNIYHTKKIHL